MTNPKLLGTYKIVDISKLFVSEFNARQPDQEPITSEEFMWLCDSIQSEGLVEPLVVRIVDSRYEIVAGTRRFAALKHIGQEQVPVIIKEMSDNDVRIASLIENVHRLDLTEEEKEWTLRQIYLTTWQEWKPTKFPIRLMGLRKFEGEHLERKTHQDYTEQDFEKDEIKILLARAYLQRLHNDANRGTLNYSKVQASKHANSTTFKQEIFPTDEFKHLSGRIGYAVSTQINILRGYGSLKVIKDYLEQLPPTVKELIEKTAKEKQLKEIEKQHLAKIAIATQKKIKRDNKHPKTPKQKIERSVKTYVNKVERGRRAEQHRKDKQKERLIDHRISKESKQFKEPETETNACRARSDILGLGHKLFELLTGQKITGIDIKENEMLAKNTHAIETMQQLTTYFVGYSDIAAQQHVIIPLNIALQKYRDILYEAVEAQRRKEEMSGQ